MSLKWFMDLPKDKQKAINDMLSVCHSTGKPLVEDDKCNCAPHRSMRTEKVEDKLSSLEDAATGAAFAFREQELANEHLKAEIAAKVSGLLTSDAIINDLARQNQSYQEVVSNLRAELAKEKAVALAALSRIERAESDRDMAQAAFRSMKSAYDSLRSELAKLIGS